MKKLITSFGALLLVTALFAQHYVQDESYKDKSFVRFKVKLLQAILDRDTNQLFPLLADNVHLSDEECSFAPKSCFKDQFKLLPVKQHYIWDDLYRIVSQGFSQTKIKNNIYRLAEKGDIVFQAPSYLKRFDDNGSKYLLVLGQNVNVREKPSTGSKIIGQVSYQKLKYHDPAVSNSKSAFKVVDGKQWYEVILPNGKKGYIIEDYVSAAIDKELSVKKINGQWKIITYYNPPPPKC